MRAKHDSQTGQETRLEERLGPHRVRVPFRPRANGLHASVAPRTSLRYRFACSPSIDEWRRPVACSAKYSAASLASFPRAVPQRVTSSKGANMHLKAGMFALQAVAATLVLACMGAHASTVNGINGGMPNRISMNVTVPKQIQGATFGEKAVRNGVVSPNKHPEGRTVPGGTFTITIACGAQACALAFPDGQGVRADLNSTSLASLPGASVGIVRSGSPAQSASLLGGALPGGAVISAAVSSVSTLSGGAGGGAAAASYARTGHVSASNQRVLRSERHADGVVDVLDPLVDGEYMLTVVVDGASDGSGGGSASHANRPGKVRVGRVVLRFTVMAGVINPLFEDAGKSESNPMSES